MKRFIKPITILFIIAWSIVLVPAQQQIQTLEDTDSLKQRRVKTNENFTLLRDQLNNSFNTISEELSTSTQTLEHKTLKAPRIFNYTKATLPAPSESGRIAYVSDDPLLFYFDTGSAWAPITSGGVALEWFGAKGDSTTDNRAFFNAAIAALEDTGLSLQLRGDYALTGPLDGTRSNIIIEAVAAGGATIRHIHGGPATVYAGIMHHDFGRYDGWTLRGINFDGGEPGDYHNTFYLSTARNITFENCQFRRLHSSLAGQALDNITIRNCKFWGTVPGVMQADVQDPPAVNSAAFSSAINFNGNSNNVTIEGNYFHFCETGVAHSGSSTDHSRTWRVRNNTFRGDWFNMPYIIYRGAATAYDNSTKVLTFGAGSLTGAWPDSDFRMMTIPVTITSGASIANINAGQLTFSSSLGTLREGDIIECANGKRAEVLSQQSSTTVTVAGWESADTFEATTPPPLATAWRITRLYSSAAIITSDTTVFLFNEPENPFTGELMVSGAGLSPVGKSCRVFAAQFYAGFHNNGGLDDLEVGPGNKFRGSRADQCSIYNTNQPRVHDNFFEMGFDEDITIQGCVEANISNNQHRLTGATGVILTPGPRSTVTGNTYDSWGVVNRTGQGAIAIIGEGVAVTGNTFNVLSGSGGIGGASPYAVIFFSAESSAGSVVTGNVDNGARTSSLFVTAETGKITARDLKTMSGPGVSNVYALVTDAPMEIGVVKFSPGSVSLPPIARGADPSQGIYLDATGTRIVAGGVVLATFANSGAVTFHFAGIDIPQAGNINWGNNTRLVRAATGILKPNNMAAGTDGGFSEGFATVAFSATPDFNVALGNTQKITLTGNVTSSTLTSIIAGQQVTFIICQDATGGRTFTWPASVKGAMTISTTASKCNCQTFISDGSTAWATSPGLTNQ